MDARAIIFFSLCLLVPMGLLACIRPAGRVVFFVVGLAVAFGFDFAMGPSGPDNPMLMIPFLGLCVALAALLVEVPAFFIRRARRRRAEADAAD